MKLAKILVVIVITLVETSFNWQFLCALMPLIIFLLPILLVCVKEKNDLKSFTINTWMILEHIDRCKDRISSSSHILNAFGYTRNLKFRNNLGKVVT